MSSISQPLAAPARQDLYIYYQVAEAAAVEAAGRMRRMQAALGCGALKRRPEASAGLLTFMEIYPAVEENFSARLAVAVEEHGVAALLASPRHSEVFVDLPAVESAPCA